MLVKYKCYFYKYVKRNMILSVIKSDLNIIGIVLFAHQGIVCSPGYCLTDLLTKDISDIIVYSLKDCTFSSA